MAQAIQPGTDGAPGALQQVARSVAAVLVAAVHAVLAPFGFLIFAALCWLWRGDEVQRARRLQRLQANAYRLMHACLSGLRILRFDHRRGLPGLPDGPCVVIANHPTLADITALCAVLGGGCTIVKPALYRRPLLHLLLRGAGHVEGPRGDPASSARAVEALVQRLQQRMRVVVFPEGTRSPDGELRHFHRLPFEIACRAGVPVVSVAITCEPLYLGKGSSPWRAPRVPPRLSLSLLAVDDPRGTGSRELRQRAEERFLAWQRQLASPKPASYDPPAKDSEWQIRSKTASNI